MRLVELSAIGADLIDRLIASGTCEKATQVVEISLRLRDAELERLRDDGVPGMEDIHMGRVEPLDMEAIKKKARNTLPV